MAEVKDITEDMAKLVLGVDNTANVDVAGYQFKLHFPSVLETLKIQTVAKNLRKDLEKDDDPDLRFQTIVLGTFEVLCDEIIKLGVTKDGKTSSPEVVTIRDSGGNLVRKTKFIEFVNGLKSPMIWVDIIFPLYENYLKFINDVAIKEKELKK